jgi:hypothetical protein
MKSKHWLLAALPAAGLVMSTSFAFGPGENPHGAPDCRKVSGQLTETLIHPLGWPNDPFGRVVGTATGVLAGVETAIVLSITPNPGNGTIDVETVNVFVTGPGDSLTALGKAVFTPIPGTANVHDLLELEIQPDESTGKFRGATGTIVMEGIGLNLFPSAVPGETQFYFKYRGRICGAKEE